MKLHRIKYVIFDLDDTLCDYQKAKKNAISLVNRVLESSGIDVNQFWNSYSLIEPTLFRQFVKGIISRDEYRLRRYADVIPGERENRLAFSSALNDIYMKEANHGITLFDDVIPSLKDLRKKEINTAILTNGPSDGQRDKIKALKLEEYINKIYISEEIGFGKPSSKVFKFVIDDLNIEPSQVLMVGDSIEDDIEGAKQLKIKTVLVDREGKYFDYKGTKIFDLSSLKEMFDSNLI
ncbi:MAG: HAD family hydrolase [Microcoleus sp. PH2017_29_MFU_D_A]|jgi:HAD superfamily hydrolase (TIGR01549 family)|uniref:HAD family hydrolase n=1 Tax=unclassified Microcoleus TaxID=2642155 RepID=UPI001D4B3FEB|nr:MULTISPECIES: HAD family hydrolase [unclassified Microcoleus]MCC3440431.1 HAD family hydrolase [Microcoleus sp. PH2017_03_ELD_O_A]MCC3468922.1 HAD family hydrolase [Microcoleus sp. PH2017_06_SFM_O_A]MCC3501728.1 HAD family hydrolase [Microcoleus sp. PH2017_19_SFW_U_A]MCC3511049.1 HAD family hydrolase [Microcoleus sp. PH2017_17_BER_D_A]TAE07283.1 MAG: HAD family hydrolase [Oscillatoriales cyanobacterium]